MLRHGMTIQYFPCKCKMAIIVKKYFNKFVINTCQILRECDRIMSTRKKEVMISI